MRPTVLDRPLQDYLTSAMQVFKALPFLLGLGVLVSVRAFYDVDEAVEARQLHIDGTDFVDPLLYARAGQSVTRKIEGRG